MRSIKQNSASAISKAFVIINYLLLDAFGTAQKIWPFSQGKRYQTRLAISCEPLVHTRLDPLSSFNATCSDHIHMVYGNKAFRSGIDFDDINRKSTTCNAKNDFSSYWSPALYSRNENGTLHLVPLMKNTVYYQTTLTSAPEGTGLTRPFKKDFRMKGGNFHVNPANPVIPDNNFTYTTWQCGNDYGYKSQHVASYLDLMKYNGTCNSWVMARIKFPDCIKDYKDDRDGVTPGKYAYSKPNNGVCPSSHPHRLPLLQLNQQYNMTGLDFDQLVLSNGDTTGLSMHGDFIAGWKPSILETALLNCKFNPAETGRWHGDNCTETNPEGNIITHPLPFKKHTPKYEATFPDEEVDGISEFPRGVGNCPESHD